MSEEGRSGKVTVSMAVEVEQYPEPGQPAAPGHFEEQQRFALGMGLVLGVVVGFFAASLSFIPDPLGALVGLVAAVWIYGQVKP